MEITDQFAGLKQWTKRDIDMSGQTFRTWLDLQLKKVREMLPMAGVTADEVY